eukprot:TRINITY_DN104358_c0_g1_i1.p1 TRINITY_DN104358_c0_g1~~TRINITY_DN104358_c0_g1_i1.p1  ORF type:complete len:708 (+),score=120.19 TRINITY_DN104358_c0_g1_i1:72-2195(+)
MGAFDYPKPRRAELKEELHGQTVDDPYRWMEDNTAEECKEWVRQQNEVSEGILDAIPWRQKVRESMTVQFDYEKRGTPYKKGDRWFYSHNTGLQNQNVIYVKDAIHNAAEEAQVFCDPNKLAEDGTSALGATDFSQSGAYWVYGVKKKGSDWSHVHVKDCKTGEDLPDRLEWVKFSGMSWTHDEKGFFYARFPAPEGMTSMTDAAGTETTVSEKQMLCYHKLGTPQSEDVVIYFDEANPKQMYSADVTEDGRYCVITVREGCIPKNLIWYIDLAGKDPAKLGKTDIVKLVDAWEWEYDFVDNDGSKFYFKTTANAPLRKLVTVDVGSSTWADAIPEHEKNPLQWCEVAKDGVLYCCYMEDVKDVLYMATLSAPTVMKKIPMDIGTVAGFQASHKTSEVFFSVTSFTFPTRIYHFDASAAEIEPKLFYETIVKGHDSSQFVTEQVFVESAEGVKVPMYIVHKKGVKRDGNNPTLLYAYGGFRISLTPSFSAFRLTFLNHFNGVYVAANIRGGSEYGEDWWKGGSLFNKQNCYVDFEACARWLHEHKVTQPSKLTIQGGSNGGLLVAAVANRAPELVGCVICQVGVLDMLRFHKFTIGHAWRSDFGDPDVKADFEYLLQYSPLHNITSAKKYPSVLVLTGDHDDRVVPLHSFKYVAELQHRCGDQANPLIARIEVDAGHGAGKPTAKIIAEVADYMCFYTSRCGATWID